MNVAQTDIGLSPATDNNFSTSVITERQLTHDAKGHCLNVRQCFSKDGAWIAYDTRNHDSQIGSTGAIEMVGVGDGEIRSLYQVPNQSAYGPGVGAVSFSPAADRVIFIHGIHNSDRYKPYGFSRRTGVAINVDQPQVPIFMDARNLSSPYIPGTLRGGTHAHQWSGDGKYISFTYNDYLIEQLQKKGNSIRDLRTVGIMFPAKVTVPMDENGENNAGEMYSLLIGRVTQDPRPGTAEIDKAFDECWIGKTGYRKPDGSRQRRAIAFQGNVMTNAGSKTEIFVVDLPAHFDQLKMKEELAHQSSTDRIKVLDELQQRRITDLPAGVHHTRHWLNSSPDGSLIAFLSEDDLGHVNVFAVSPNGGLVRQLSFNAFDATSGPSFSPNGDEVAYIANEQVFVTELATGKSRPLTVIGKPENAPVGGVNWSPDGKTLAFNRYTYHEQAKQMFLQIFLLSR